ncbi:MAG: YchJ family metal-binding protein [Gordonia sp. (in: high G+C Gram-positive bacteria)]
MSPRLDHVTDRCPCGSGDPLADCCGRYLTGGPREGRAPSAEALMRSRYTAFAVGDADYLLASWHPGTRPSSLTLDDDQRWLHLTVVDAQGGGPFDVEGSVEFVAAYRTPEGRGELCEFSRFVREGGRWLYVDGDLS